jgi:SAM-dependent methyltransferase
MNTRKPIITLLIILNYVVTINIQPGYALRPTASAKQSANLETHLGDPVIKANSAGLSEAKELIIQHYFRGLEINLKKGRRQQYGRYKTLSLNKNNASIGSLLKTVGLADLPKGGDGYINGMTFLILYYDNKPAALLAMPDDRTPQDVPLCCTSLINPGHRLTAKEKDILQKGVSFINGNKREVIFHRIDTEESEVLGEITGRKGMPLVGLPGVFGANADDIDNKTNGMTTEAIIKGAFPLIKEGDRVLVVGCGRGPDVIAAALSRASLVHAIDISELEIQNTLLNLKLWGLENRVKVFKNLGLKGLERYDVIIFNAPLINLRPSFQNLGKASLAVEDINGKIALDFLGRLKDHLLPGGVAVYSNDYDDTNSEWLNRVFREQELSADIVLSVPITKTAYVHRESFTLETRHVVFRISLKAASAGTRQLSDDLRVDNRTIAIIQSAA